MLAYKFLDAAGRSIFSGTAWPLPAAGSPGAWIEAAAVVPCRSGVHACRPEHLAYWINADLWEIELGGEIRDLDHQVVAARGRLTRRCESWRRELVAGLGARCAWRVRDLAVDAARAGGLTELAERMAACQRLDELAAMGPSVEAAGDGGTHRLAALAADAAGMAQHGEPMEAPFVAAVAASLAAGRRGADEDAAFHAERASQSSWIAARLPHAA